MNFTKATYRVARSRAMNEVYSRADILEWAKHERHYEDSPYGAWEREYLTGEARDAYQRAVNIVIGINARGSRERGLWKP